MTETMTLTASKLKETSIFSAESYAIHLAMSMIRQKEERQCTLCSDSLSVLRELMNRSDHPMLRKILHGVDDLHRQDRIVRFCWVPSRINIPDNEKADAATKEAARRPEEFIPIYYKDWNASIEHKMKKRWTSQWMNSGSRLLDIAAKPGDLEVRYTNRRDEVVLNRVRVGHSFITHGYLMDNDVPDVPPICNVCNEAQLTIKHILLMCPRLDQVRKAKVSVCRTEQRSTLRETLGNNTKPKEIMLYLRIIEIYNQI